MTYSDGKNEFADYAEILKDEMIDFHALSLYPNIAKIFGASKSFMIFVRPDNYIGFISEDVSGEELRKYLSQNFIR